MERKGDGVVMQEKLKMLQHRLLVLPFDSSYVISPIFSSTLIGKS